MMIRSKRRRWFVVDVTSCAFSIRRDWKSWRKLLCAIKGHENIDTVGVVKFWWRTDILPWALKTYRGSLVACALCQSAAPGQKLYVPFPDKQGDVRICNVVLKVLTDPSAPWEWE